MEISGQSENVSENVAAACASSRLTADPGSSHASNSSRAYVYAGHCCSISLLTVILNLLYQRFSQISSLFLGIAHSKAGLGFTQSRPHQAGGPRASQIRHGSGNVIGKDGINGCRQLLHRCRGCGRLLIGVSTKSSILGIILPANTWHCVS
jgi:hypothetical protein